MPRLVVVSALHQKAALHARRPHVLRELLEHFAVVYRHRRDADESAAQRQTARSMGMWVEGRRVGDRDKKYDTEQSVCERESESKPLCLCVPSGRMCASERAGEIEGT